MGFCMQFLFGRSKDLGEAIRLLLRGFFHNLSEVLLSCNHWRLVLVGLLQVHQPDAASRNLHLLHDSCFFPDHQGRIWQSYSA